MKKFLLIILFLQILVICPLCSIDLKKLYQRGVIELKNNGSFGMKTDWDGIFFDRYKEIEVAPDGSVFVSNNRQHNIHIFDKNGTLIKTFGQKGQGPGDMYHPGRLSILDEKYLVVGHYASSRRISLFELNGKHVKEIKTQGSVFQITALSGYYLAYVSPQYTGKLGESWERVFIHNIQTNQARFIKKTFKHMPFLKISEAKTVGVGGVSGEMFIGRTNEGHLSVAYSKSSKIEIFSNQGKLIKTIDLKITPIPITEKYIRAVREKMIKPLRRGKNAGSQNTKVFINKLSRAPFKSVMGSHLPLFSELLVDAEGNFLVFLKGTELENPPVVFRVYSPDGDFICQSELKSPEFEIKIDRRFRNLAFTNHGIFALLQVKDEEDTNLRLIKIAE